MIQCSRAGVSHFIIEAPPAEHATIRTALGSFAANPGVTIVDSLNAAGGLPKGIDPSAPSIALRGNLVMAQSQLRRMLADYAINPGRELCFTSADDDCGGMIRLGPLGHLMQGGDAGAGSVGPANGASADGGFGGGTRLSLRPPGQLPVRLQGRAARRG